MAEKGKSKEELLKETLNLFKISEKYLLSSRVDQKACEVIMVTHGGKKIHHKIGEPAEITLTDTDITGNPPKEETIWNEKMNQRFSIAGMFKKMGIGSRL